MNQTFVDRIARAVLYEGYILYPYRPALKNRQRWTFGGIVPESYSLAQRGAEAWTMQTECLVEGRADSGLSVTVRSLHLVDRQVGVVTPTGSFQAVETLEVDGTRHYTWQEAQERTIRIPIAVLGALAHRLLSVPFHFPAQHVVERLCSHSGEVGGVVVRRQESIQGSIELSAERVGEGQFKVRVRILNQTPLVDAQLKSRDEAMLHSLVSTHTILEIDAGSFISLIDPPAAWRAIAADCRNEGTWPVLVGENGARDAMLSAPIILYDYPQVAAESAGDYFDGTEMDEMLALRVMTLTSAEKDAMAALDERANAILQRTHSLDEQQMRELHGTVRGGEEP